LFIGSIYMLKTEVLGQIIMVYRVYIKAGRILIPSYSAKFSAIGFFVTTGLVIILSGFS